MLSAPNRAVTILAPRRRPLTLVLAISVLILLLAIGVLAVTGAWAGDGSAVAGPIQAGFARPT